MPCTVDSSLSNPCSGLSTPDKKKKMKTNIKLCNQLRDGVSARVAQHFQTIKNRFSENLPNNKCDRMASRPACRESDSTARNQSPIAQSSRDSRAEATASAPFLLDENKSDQKQVDRCYRRKSLTSIFLNFLINSIEQRSQSNVLSWNDLLTI